MERGSGTCKRRGCIPVSTKYAVMPLKKSWSSPAPSPSSPTDDRFLFFFFSLLMSTVTFSYSSRNRIVCWIISFDQKPEMNARKAKKEFKILALAWSVPKLWNTSGIQFVGGACAWENVQTWENFVKEKESATEFSTQSKQNKTLITFSNLLHAYCHSFMHSTHQL